MLNHPATVLSLSDGGRIVRDLRREFPNLYADPLGGDRARGPACAGEGCAMQSAIPPGSTGWTIGRAQPGMKADVNIIDLEG